MRFNRSFMRFVLAAAALLLATSGSSRAETKPAPATGKSGLATFTVTAVGKKEGAPTIALDDVQLFVGKERKQIADWKPGDKLFLAILIDDSIDSGAASNWGDLKAFIMAQPASTFIAVGYIRNNTTMIAQDFTDNHELAAKALRITLGASARGSSPYLATMDMLKRWPNSDVRRSIILISSGIDYFRGPSYGTFSPDLDSVISRSQRQNTNIWSVYYPSSGHRGRAFSLVSWGQNNLDKLAEDTGAEAYFLGTQAPVSLKPYFDEIGEHLSNQYLLSFAANGGDKGKLQRVQVKTELKNVEILTPSAVFLPPTK